MKSMLIMGLLLIITTAGRADTVLSSQGTPGLMCAIKSQTGYDLAHQDPSGDGKSLLWESRDGNVELYAVEYENHLGAKFFTIEVVEHFIDRESSNYELSLDLNKIHQFPHVESEQIDSMICFRSFGDIIFHHTNLNPLNLDGYHYRVNFQDLHSDEAKRIFGKERNSGKLAGQVQDQKNDSRWFPREK